MADLPPVDPILHPRSIALIGASRDPDSMSGVLLRNLKESFPGAIYPVNPLADQICGLKAFASIGDVPEAVDLALVAVPSRCVLDVVKQCIDSGVRGLVVISAGFGETGDEGERRAEQLQRLAEHAAVPLVGPNCLGVLSTSTDTPFNATFSATQPQPGHVSVLTQSGAFGFVFPEYNRRRSIGISKLVSLGNKLCLGENDFLTALEHDDQTSVVQLYLESFQNPNVFREIATRVARKKPIVALKAGRTMGGQRAAGSHTAALATPTAASDALFRQSGVISTASLDELFDITALLATQSLPRGRRVAVLTNAGGPGVLCADAIETAKLQLPEFSIELQQQLREFLPNEATVRNPIDLIGSTDPEEFARCLDLILRSNETDSTIVIYVPRIADTSDAIAARIVDVSQKIPQTQTLLSVFMQQESAPSVLSSASPPVPAWMFPEAAVRALCAATGLVEWRNRQLTTPFDRTTHIDVDQVQRTLQRAPEGWLDPERVDALLNAAGIKTARQAVAKTFEEAIAAAEQMGFPVVVKAIAPGLIHRSESGAVIVDIRDSASLRHAAEHLITSISGCHSLLVQQFVDCEREVMMGVTHEPGFGHLIGFGLGGVNVEVLGDVSFRLHPLTLADAEELVREHPVSRLLAAHRNRPAGDMPALIETVMRLSELLAACPSIAEADLNPVKVLDDGGGVCVVDAGIRMMRSSETGRIT